MEQNAEDFAADKDNECELIKKAAELYLEQDENELEDNPDFMKKVRSLYMKKNPKK